MMTRTKTSTTAAKNKPAGSAVLEAAAHGATTSEAENSAEECEVQPNQSSQPTLGDLQMSILDFKNFLTTKLDKISNDVVAINQRFDELKATVNFNSDKISDIEKKTLPELEKSLEKRIVSLENKITQMEIHNRKSNLLFYGLQQKEGENVYEVLKGAFVSLGVDDGAASRIAIANAHRLPRREDGAQAAQQAPLPIIARFSFMGDRNRILAAFEDKQRKRTKDTAQPGPVQLHFTVRTDLPPAMKARRAVLAKEAYKLRKEKGLATKIFVKGINVHLQWKEKGTSSWNYFED